MTRATLSSTRTEANPNDPRHKGYISWSPEDVFIKAYRPVDGLTFGQALEALKAGKKIARAGWNGKAMYLWLKPASTIKAEWCRDPMLDAINANGGEILALGSICMFTYDGKGSHSHLACSTACGGLAHIGGLNKYKQERYKDGRTHINSRSNQGL